MRSRFGQGPAQQAAQPQPQQKRGGNNGGRGNVCARNGIKRPLPGQLVQQRKEAGKQKDHMQQQPARIPAAGSAAQPL